MHGSLRHSLRSEWRHNGISDLWVKMHLTNKGNPIVGIKRSNDRRISTTRFPILVKRHIYRGPDGYAAVIISYILYMCVCVSALQGKSISPVIICGASGLIICVVLPMAQDHKTYISQCSPPTPDYKIYISDCLPLTQHYKTYISQSPRWLGTSKRI